MIGCVSDGLPQLDRYRHTGAVHAKMAEGTAAERQFAAGFVKHKTDNGK